MVSIFSNKNNNESELDIFIKYMLFIFFIFLSLLLLNPIYKSLVIAKFGKVQSGQIEKMTSDVYISEGMGNKECFTYLKGYEKPIKDCFFQEGISENDNVKYFIANNDTEYVLKFTSDNSFWGIFSANSPFGYKMLIIFYLLVLVITYLITISIKAYRLINSIFLIRKDYKIIYGIFFKNLYSFLLFICGIILGYFLFLNLTQYLVDRYTNLSGILNIIVFLSLIIFCFTYPYIFHKTVNYIVFSDKNIIEKIAKTGSLYILINLLIALIVSIVDKKDLNIFEVIYNFYKGLLGF